MVTLTLRVLSRPDVDHLPKIYQSLGMDYDERVLPSIGNEVLKSIVAQFDAAELITQREVVSVTKLINGIRGDAYSCRCLRESGRIYCSVLANSTSSWKMYPSHI
jgi:regulator of protease activity HflC (stomatin/prohibitin superfamily)